MKTAVETAQSGLNILLVDDDIALCEFMQEFFRAKGIRLEVVHDGRRGLSRALNGRHDLVLLDVMLPGLDGFELLHLVRRQNQIPIIMLTARCAQDERIAGLDAGADDFLQKPFGPEELLARIHAILRRLHQTPHPSAVLEAGGIRIVPSAREVHCNDVLLDLTTAEYDILEFLVRSAGRVVSREELTAAIYRRRPMPVDRALDVHISNLRRKLGSHASLITTVRGVGYLFRRSPLG